VSPTRPPISRVDDAQAAIGVPSTTAAHRSKGTLHYAPNSRGLWACYGLGTFVTDRRLSMRPSELTWTDQPALEEGAQFAVLLGDLTQPGSYVFRLHAPAGHRAMPHTHPDERIYTVLSGTFHLGFGHRYDESRLEEYPSGSVVVVRADRHHFQLARSGDYVVQVEGIGPTAVTYVNPRNDPRLRVRRSGKNPAAHR